MMISAETLAQTAGDHEARRAAMGAEIARLQAQVNALADVAEKYLEWVKPMIKDPGMLAIERAAIAALAAAGR